MGIARDCKEEKPAAVRFPIAFTLEQFRADIVALCFAHLRVTMSMADARAGLRMIGLNEAKVEALSQRMIDEPADAGLTYEGIADWELVRSLVAMYRYGFLGQPDTSVEELGPGGYHIGVAALVRDLSRSSFVRFLEHVGAPGVTASIARCMHVVELANARLTLEDQPRFFNFDGKDDDMDLGPLIDGGSPELPQGGYGATLTVRQMALLSGLAEQSIRTFADPKRPNHLRTEQCKGRVVVRVEDAKAWLIQRQRYVSISDPIDSAEVEMKRRPFASLNELQTIVVSRLARCQPRAPLVVLHELVERQLGCAVEPDDAARLWMTNPGCVREVAALVGLRQDLFALRVSETMFADALQQTKRRIEALSMEAA